MSKPTLHPTLIERWLAQYQRVANVYQNALARHVKEKMRHLLPAHFPNAAIMLDYARRLRVPVEQLEQVRTLYKDYNDFVQQLQGVSFYLYFFLRFVIEISNPHFF